MEKTTIDFLVLLFSIGVLITVGFFCVIRPKEARQRYLAGFKLDEELRWDDPRTWLRFIPSLWAFRIFGMIFILLGLLVLCLWRAGSD